MNSHENKFIYVAHSDEGERPSAHPIVTEGTLEKELLKDAKAFAEKVNSLTPNLGKLWKLLKDSGYSSKNALEVCDAIKKLEKVKVRKNNETNEREEVRLKFEVDVTQPDRNTRSSLLEKFEKSAEVQPINAIVRFRLDPEVTNPIHFIKSVFMDPDLESQTVLSFPENGGVRQGSLFKVAFGKYNKKQEKPALLSVDDIDAMVNSGAPEQYKRILGGEILFTSENLKRHVHNILAQYHFINRGSDIGITVAPILDHRSDVQSEVVKIHCAATTNIEKLFKELSELSSKYQDNNEINKNDKQPNKKNQKKPEKKKSIPEQIEELRGTKIKSLESELSTHKKNKADAEKGLKADLDDKQKKAIERKINNHQERIDKTTNQLNAAKTELAELIAIPKSNVAVNANGNGNGHAQEKPGNKIEPISSYGIIRADGSYFNFKLHNEQKQQKDLTDFLLEYTDIGMSVFLISDVNKETNTIKYTIQEHQGDYLQDIIDFKDKLSNLAPNIKFKHKLKLEYSIPYSKETHKKEISADNGFETLRGEFEYQKKQIWRERNDIKFEKFRKHILNDTIFSSDRGKNELGLQRVAMLCHDLQDRSVDFDNISKDELEKMYHKITKVFKPSWRERVDDKGISHWARDILDHFVTRYIIHATKEGNSAALKNINEHISFIDGWLPKKLGLRMAKGGAEPNL